MFMRSLATSWFRALSFSEGTEVLVVVEWGTAHLNIGRRIEQSFQIYTPAYIHACVLVGTSAGA